MSNQSYLTPFADVNAVLQEFYTSLQALLGSQLVGIYIYGSLAQGAFDPLTSDIDFVVVTDAELDDALFEQLQALHAHFAASRSPWAAKIEALYVPQDVLRHPIVPLASYPQIEQGTVLLKAPLEEGWMFQRSVLREQGLVVSGPEPWTLIDPIAPDDLRQAAAEATATIAGEWQTRASGDPSWLAWVRVRENQVFVVLTLCRLLYSLEVGAVASKPGAAAWAQQQVGQPWTDLITRALPGQQESGEISTSEMDETLAFIRYTLGRLP